MSPSRRTFFHIISPEKEKNILSRGIRSNRKGEIKLLGELRIGNVNMADHEAIYFYGLKEYVLLKIKPKGIEGKITGSPGSTFEGKTDYTLHQKKIEPEFVQIIGRFRPDQQRLLADTMKLSLSRARKK